LYLDQHHVVVVGDDDGHGVPEVGEELEDHFPSQPSKVLQACHEDKLRSEMIVQN
jgi:hypothetical protein